MFVYLEFMSTFAERYILRTKNEAHHDVYDGYDDAEIALCRGCRVYNNGINQIQP